MAEQAQRNFFALEQNGICEQTSELSKNHFPGSEDKNWQK